MLNRGMKKKKKKKEVTVPLRGLPQSALLHCMASKPVKIQSSAS